MDKTISKITKEINQILNKKLIITIAIILTVIFAYFFVYKPYFTIEGKIWREVKEERMLEQKVIYYACGLSKEHKYHKMFMKECNKLNLKSEYEDVYQDCSPDYMGGCN